MRHMESRYDKISDSSSGWANEKSNIKRVMDENLQTDGSEKLGVKRLELRIYDKSKTMKFATLKLISC